DPERSSQRVLARREQHRIDNDPSKGGKVDVLVEDVRGFQLEFLDPITSSWVKTWDTTQLAMQPNRLPAQIRIRITIRDPRNEKKELTLGTRAVLPMTY